MTFPPQPFPPFLPSDPASLDVLKQNNLKAHEKVLVFVMISSSPFHLSHSNCLPDQGSWRALSVFGDTDSKTSSSSSTPSSIGFILAEARWCGEDISAERHRKKNCLAQPALILVWCWNSHRNIQHCGHLLLQPRKAVALNIVLHLTKTRNASQPLSWMTWALSTLTVLTKSVQHLFRIQNGMPTLTAHTVIWVPSCLWKLV